LLAYSKQQNHSPESGHLLKTLVSSDNEKTGIQYLGGYGFKNLHKKHARKKTMAVLKAGKLRNITDSSQKLELALSCSGLWIITQPAEQVFLHFETTILISLEP